MPNRFHLPATKKPTAIAAMPYIRLITTATKPSLYATPPQTTNVPAENIVMNPLSPDAHQGDFSPAANMSFVSFTFTDSPTPTAKIPST